MHLFNCVHTWKGTPIVSVASASIISQYWLSCSTSRCQYDPPHCRARNSILFHLHKHCHTQNRHPSCRIAVLALLPHSKAAPWQCRSGRKRSRSPDEEGDVSEGEEQTMPVDFHGITNQAVCVPSMQSSTIISCLQCLKHASCSVMHQMF